MKTLLLVLILFTSTVFSFAQKSDKDQFTGTWTINISDTKIPGYVIRPNGAFLETSLQDSVFKLTLKEVRNGETFVLKERTYYTDGRGETNGSDVTKTKLKGNKIVAVIQKPKKSDQKTDEVKPKNGERVIGTITLETETTTTWEISKDGKTLSEIEVIKTTTNSSGSMYNTGGPLAGSGGYRSEKNEAFRLVYDRKN